MSPDTPTPKARPTYADWLRTRRPIAGAEDPDERTVLDRLTDQRDALLTELQSQIEQRQTQRAEFETRTAAEDEEQRPSEEQRTEFAASEQSFSEQIAERMAEVRVLDSRIEEERALERSRGIAARASSGGGSVSVTSEPLTYRRDNARETSYWMDLAAQQVPQVRETASAAVLDGYQERLQRHAREMESVIEVRSRERDRLAERRIEAAEQEFRGRYGARGAFDASPFETRAPNRVPGQGGYVVPPLWLIDDYIPALRPGRVAVGMMRNMPLPSGTDSINVPKLNVPTLTAVQTADNAPVASRDFTDTFVQANVKTIAGQEDVPIQLLEQSPGQILDQILTTDLVADYNKQVDLQGLVGNGVGAPLSGGQIVGLYPASNWGANTVPWTQATPVGSAFFQLLAAMASKTATTRFNLMDFGYLLHPRRWFWGASYPDSTGRPLVSSSSFNPFNPQALEQSMVPAEGYVGQVPFGPRVHIDANVPTTDGAGVPGAGTADIAIGAIWDDIWFFEGDLRTRVLSEVLSGTLQVRFQVYNYVAMLARYGPSITLAYGTGLAAPTGDGGAIAFT